MKGNKRTLVVILALILLQACKIADISEKRNLSSQESTRMAEQKLSEVVKKQGFNVLKQENTYKVKLSDHWPGFLGSLVKLWTNDSTNLSIQYNFNTFDGKAQFLDGKRKGDVIGIQSWQYYEKPINSKLIKMKAKGAAKKLQFGLVTIHYFIELAYRLHQAPYKQYYGETSFNGKLYDRVFVSWKGEEAMPEYDQYILWINKETQLIDFCLYTLRDNKNPFTRNKYGSIAFQDYQDVNGFLVPFKMPVMLDDQILRGYIENDYFHRFIIESFEFKDYREDELYPFKNLPKQIDTK